MEFLLFMLLGLMEESLLFMLLVAVMFLLFLIVLAGFCAVANLVWHFFSLARVRTLVEAGADLNMKDEAGEPPPYDSSPWRIH